HSPAVLAVDSLETLRMSPLHSPGQLQGCADRLAELAGTGTTTIVVVRTREDGSIVGFPTFGKLEHDAAVILRLQQDGDSRRILRALKNRYGPTDEVGTFEVRDDLFIEVEADLAVEG